MANVTVTMLQSGRTDDWGRPLVAGNSYSLDFDRAKSLWQAGFASVRDPGVFDDDSTPFNGGHIRYMRFSGFRKSLLPALVAGATASRTAGVVTISATGHGITTGATYVGFRVFYPGSPSLAAGWYDAVLSVPDANTVTFSAPGPDFSSESVNGGAAYTLTTDFCLLTVPGGLVKPWASLRPSALWGGDATAAVKSQRMRIGNTSIVIKQTTTSPHVEVTCVLRIGETLQVQHIGSAENAVVTNMNSYSFDFAGDVSIGVAGTLPSAGTFLTLYGASLLVEI